MSDLKSEVGFQVRSDTVCPNTFKKYQNIRPIYSPISSFNLPPAQSGLHYSPIYKITDCAVSSMHYTHVQVGPSRAL